MVAGVDGGLGAVGGAGLVEDVADVGHTDFLSLRKAELDTDCPLDRHQVG
jgi:hypothetical protein